MATNGHPTEEASKIARATSNAPHAILSRELANLDADRRRFAYRLITVREGDRIEKIPVIQAILRKVAVNAANGNTRAQRIYLDLVIGAEADRSAAAAELLRAAVEGKEYWANIFAEYDRRGIEQPDPVPHPDDAVIDYKTGEVRINGPVMAEQKGARETALFNKNEFEKSLERCIKAMEADP